MNTMLLLIAICVSVVFFLPLFFVQSLRRRKMLEQFHLNLAVNIDYVWGALLFGADGHTVSAICFKRQAEGSARFARYVRVINWLFRDNEHCVRAYRHEFMALKKKGHSHEKTDQ